MEHFAGGGVVTTCPFCSCGCGLTLLHDSHHTTGTAPLSSHPVSRGRLCARGWSAHEPDAWGERLLHPRMGRGDQARAVDWDQALAMAAAELRALVDAGRRVGVLVAGRSTNEEAYLAAKLARGALRSGSVDSFLRPQYQALLQGLGDRGRNGRAGVTLEALEESDRILLLEGDLATTHPRVAFSILRALRRGAHLVTLGPAPTQMSRLAAVHLPLGLPAPHLLPPGLLSVLESGRLAGGGGLTVVLAPSPRDPAALTETVRAIATAVGGADGNGTVRFLPLPILANSRGAFEVGAAPNRLPGVRPLGDARARERLRKAWGVDPCQDPGHGAEVLLEEVEGLVLIREDPARCAREPAAVRERLLHLRSLVVADAHPSLASRVATVTLPLAALSETEGSFTSLEGRLQRVHQAVPPPGGARAGWQVLSDLLRLLGLGSGAPDLEAVHKEMGEAIPEYGALFALSGEASGPAAVPLLAEDDPTPHGDPQAPHPQDAAPGTHWLVLDGSYDWLEDRLVEISPTLRRDGAARRKLRPQGEVTMSPSDGQALGVRAGWSVRVRSPAGEVVVPVNLSSRVDPGLLLAPFGFRELLAPVLGAASVQRVEVERT